MAANDTVTGQFTGRSVIHRLCSWTRESRLRQRRRMAANYAVAWCFTARSVIHHLYSEVMDYHSMYRHVVDLSF
ncbi:hypothetical protein J6590_061899 [Homalodisca vitripennis]|nr:hypothetical protein J6590_061899 [Homalodisca vitripennis]